MLQLCIDEPAELIEAAEKLGGVEIREEEKPDWRGG
jgi:hypothetical protein